MRMLGTVPTARALTVAVSLSDSTGDELRRSPSSIAATWAAWLCAGAATHLNPRSQGERRP